MALKSSITLKDVYDVVNRLEDKFDEKYENVDSRLSRLESTVNKAVGVVSLVGIFTSVIASYVWNRVIGKA